MDVLLPGSVPLLVLQLTLALVAGILRAVVRMYILQILVKFRALLAFLLSEFSETAVPIHDSYMTAFSGFYDT